MKLTLRPWYHTVSTIFGYKYDYYFKFLNQKLAATVASPVRNKYFSTCLEYQHGSRMKLLSPSVLRITYHNSSFGFCISKKHDLAKISANIICLPNCAYFINRYATETDPNKKQDGKLILNNASTVKKSPIDQNLEEDESKLGLVKKFKLMYKRYWYVLIPVHVFTSLIWYGSFFFAAKSGVDIVPLLENLGLSDKFLYYLKESNAGYYGIAYAMYKIATPARYTITLGGTTISINYLKNRGYIKPVPTKDELKVMYQDKKDEIKDRTDEMREKYQGKKEEILEKAGEIREKYHDRKEEMREKYQEKKEELMGRGQKPQSEDSSDSKQKKS